jgi:DNA-binding transcriptional regulator GbsR (MarR family)
MEQYREQIERYSNYYEKQGFSPVAARVMIYLFLHPEGEATFDEIQAYFNVSKSAVSNALRLLSAMQIVTERTKSGERKRYFKASLQVLFSPEAVIKNYRDTRHIIEEILVLRNKQDTASQQLEDIVSLIKVIETEFPKLYKKALGKKQGKEA